VNGWIRRPPTRTRYLRADTVQREKPFPRARNSQTETGYRRVRARLIVCRNSVGVLPNFLGPPPRRYRHRLAHRPAAKRPPLGDVGYTDYPTLRTIGVEEEPCSAISELPETVDTLTYARADLADTAWVLSELDPVRGVQWSREAIRSRPPESGACSGRLLIIALL
jgi:hypothetical protein